ncbi:hypothetical protein [Steroidobacter agaridevorans]|uniref:hypothetical protein n=1 Tax=Steroidobacter agaridevorans TaxID=2695856 RepID=UPI00132650FA|nr:hypothetical protein [Steroidobacter agaridevorans]GFE89471.1 hypothetical protein GCM10011488_44250 [Steroidobacter agaridevorans]
MKAWNARLWDRVARRILIAGCCVISMALSVDASAAIRRFEMALFGNSNPGYTDLAWFSAGQSQPAGRAIMSLDGVYQNPNLAGYLASLGYDWSRVAAVVIDEPYWFATGATNWENPCAPGDPRINAIWATETYLQNAAAAVKSIAPATRFWVNFSEPEMTWMQASCIFNRSYIDVISLDKYMVPFSTVQPYYNWIVSHRSKNSQQLALVPGTFHRNSPSYQNPSTPASWLAGYFNYANSLNAQGWDAPMVWLVAGFFGWDELEVIPGEFWHGITHPTAAPILQTWQAQFNNQGYNTMAGFIESLDPASGLVTGWAVDRTAVIPPYVDIYVDGGYWGTTVPNGYRGDIANQYGISVSQWSFTLPYNDGGCHSIQAFAVAHTAESWNHTTLKTLIGSYFCF